MEGKTRSKVLINNDFYDLLGNNWYASSDHPIALLRAENEARAPWVLENIQSRMHTSIKALDIGCGAGFLSNPLALFGHDVTGIDLSKESLATAAHFDETKKAKYLYGNALDLPFPDASFDVTIAMDILEHVEDPHQLIKEAARVLKPNGLFFFHTFNKNPLSYFLIIKGVEWCVKNTPKNMHVYQLFLPPKKVEKMCLSVDLEVETLVGLRPKANRPFFKMLFTRKVPKNFSFCFSKSLVAGYCGIARKIK